MAHRIQARHRNIISYIDAALQTARFSRLPDGTYAASIPGCNGVYVFGESAEECQRRLRPALAAWIRFRIQFGQILPVIRGINLNEGDILQ